MLRHRSLIMLFSDLLGDPTEILQSLRQLRHGGHDVILFHILDEAEVNFPFDGLIEFEDPETNDRVEVDATSFRQDYLQEINDFRQDFQRNCFQIGIDYVPLDTSMQFDKRCLNTCSAAARGVEHTMAFVNLSLLIGGLFTAIPHRVASGDAPKAEAPDVSRPSVSQATSRNESPHTATSTLAVDGVAVPGGRGGGSCIRAPQRGFDRGRRMADVGQLVRDAVHRGHLPNLLDRATKGPNADRHVIDARRAYVGGIDDQHDWKPAEQPECSAG